MTIWDVRVARFAERQMANAPAVLDRTAFARRGIIMAAIVIISCSLMQVLCSHFSALLTGQLGMIFRKLLWTWKSLRSILLITALNLASFATVIMPSHHLPTRRGVTKWFHYILLINFSLLSIIGRKRGRLYTYGCGYSRGAVKIGRAHV